VYSNFQADYVEESRKELAYIAFFKGNDGAGHFTCVHRTAMDKWQHSDGLRVSTTTVTFSEEGLLTEVCGEHPKENLSHVCLVVYKSSAVAMPLSVAQHRDSKQQSETWRLKITAEHHADQHRFSEHHKKVLQSMAVVRKVRDSKELS
jgi:hypothetical protein